MQIKIGLADDQRLFLKSLSTLINTFQHCTVVANSLNGEELMKRLEEGNRPEIILLDVSMPVMNGVQTAKAIKARWPEIRIAALSTHDDDITIISMLRAKCCAYFLKDIDPDELEKAIHEIMTDGYYNGDPKNVRCRRLMEKGQQAREVYISDREMQFVKLACSERPYKQIADEMGLAERTIDGYRESLFDKLNVRSRVGMAIEAIRRGWVVV